MNSDYIRCAEHLLINSLEFGLLTGARGGSRGLRSVDRMTFAIGLQVGATTRLEVCRIVMSYFSLRVCATDSDLRSQMHP